MVKTEDRIYQAYYTKSTPIVDYMLNRLEVKHSDAILEPCGGDGVFVDALLQQNKNVSIDVYELNGESVEVLMEKFETFNNVTIYHADTLLDDNLDFRAKFQKGYDKVIANPPYGAWQEYTKRAKLKKIFPNLYAKETYTLFLYRCIQLLSDGGKLCFIVPDTFLNLHMHKSIREFLLCRTKICEILLFPSSFFPGVNFGYANLSIITLERCDGKQTCLNNQFRIISGFKSVDELGDPDALHLEKTHYTQKELLNNDDFTFFRTNNKNLITAINNSPTRVGDIADCVTGFYSGNDKEYLRSLDPNHKNAKNYRIVDKSLIGNEYLELPDLLSGISDTKHFVPVLKGGNTKYYKQDNWYMDWSMEAVAHYKTDKKSRFQNSQYYFKYGIGVPMVSSSRISAALLENKLFDQSIVGIFPKDEKYVLYLLAFFNSTTCNKLIRAINPSANNPANYIKRIPFIEPDSSTLQMINIRVTQIVNSLKEDGTYDQTVDGFINDTFADLYGF